MTSADVVCKVICDSHGKNASEAYISDIPFLKNVGIQTSSTITNTLRTLRQRLYEQQVRSAALLKKLDELKRNGQKIVMEFKEYRRQHEEQNRKLHDELQAAILSSRN